MKVKAKAGIHNHLFDEYDHQHLKENKKYIVIGISCENFRIINENYEPILYPKYLFDIIDASIPSNWIRKEYESDEYYVDPPELSEHGFYEDFFDDKEKAIKIFRDFVIKNGYMTNTEINSSEWIKVLTKQRLGHL